MRTRSLVLQVFLAVITAHLQTSWAFKPDTRLLVPSKVLVVGAAGKVGKQVVRRLQERGFEVRALARDTSKVEILEGAGGRVAVEVVRGDVTDKQSLAAAMRGCQACIACHGSSRISKLSDLWTHPSKDLRHPYYVNSLGVRRLAEAAAESEGCKRLVRITGLSVGLPAWNPVAAALNLLASMAVCWQMSGERELRSAAARDGVDYTIVRPGGLTDEDRPEGACLALASDGQPTPSKLGYRISRADVANLMVAVLEHDNIRRATLSCVWGKDPGGPQEWGPLLEKVLPDKTPLPQRPYRPVVLGLFGALLSVAAVAAVTAARLAVATSGALAALLSGALAARQGATAV